MALLSFLFILGGFMYLYSRHSLNEVQEVINFYNQKGYDYKTIQQLNYMTLYNEYKKYKEEKMMDKPKIIWRDCSFCNIGHNKEKMTKITYEEPHMEPRSYYICPNCAAIFNELFLLGKIYQQIHTGAVKFEK